MKSAAPIWKILTKVAIVLLATFFIGGTALAVDQPPQDSDHQRPWLVGHLITDMEALGTFDGNTLAKVPAIVDALTDDQVALLSQDYFLIRSKTEQDASLYAMQQRGDSEEQVNEARAQIADLLTAMSDQIAACYDQLVSMPQPVQYVAQICYASVPGWCCNAGCFVPDWYYDNGCYVGPCCNAACSGSWAVPVYNAYQDHGSHFYATYHNVANAAHIKRSVNLAKRRANWLRHQGDWKSVVAHDRLMHKTRIGPTRLPAGTQTRAVPVRNPHPPVAQVGSNFVRQPIVHKQVAKPQVKHILASHPAKVVHQKEVKPHANHAPALHASHPAVHVSHPRPVAHAPQAHARSGDGKHR